MAEKAHVRTSSRPDRGGSACNPRTNGRTGRRLRDRHAQLRAACQSSSAYRSTCLVSVKTLGLAHRPPYFHTRRLERSLKNLTISRPVCKHPIDGELERILQMWLQTESTPDSRGLRLRQSHLESHHARAPVGRSGINGLGRCRRAGPGRIRQSIQTTGYKPRCDFNPFFE